MSKYFEILVSFRPGKVLSVVILSVSFSAGLLAQKPGSSERFQYLRKTPDKYNTSISTFSKGLPFVTLSQKSLRIYSPDGGTVILTVTSNRRWMLYCSEKWILTDPAAGGGFNEVVFKVMDNPEPYERTARIEINADGLPVKIVILSQKARHDE